MNVPDTDRHWRFDRIWLVLMLLLVADDTSAQNRSLLNFYNDNNRSYLSVDRVNRLSDRVQQEMASQVDLLTGPLPPLEGAVDVSEYIVGPNDQFMVAIGGLEPIVRVVPVSSDGRLVLLGAGQISVAGRTLEQALSDVTSALQDQYQNVPVQVTLAQPRMFYVHVTGAVPEPGRHLAMPVARVEDALTAAFMSPTFEPPVSNASFRPALRNVQITHRNGSTRSVDLVRYYRTGDTAHNPYVQDGDMINVPSFMPEQEAVYVDGAVAHGGMYDYRPGDTLLDILRITAGPYGVSNMGTVYLTRHRPDGTTETESHEVKTLLAADVPIVPVHPLDRVHVPFKNREMGMVEVIGEVEYPGIFPIEIGKTTLQEVIRQAGGMRSTALVRAAYLERGVVEVEEHGNVLAEVEMVQRRGLPRFFMPLSDSSNVLQQMRLNELDFLSRHYLARSLYQENRVSVDVQAAMAAGADPVYLQDRDRLVVPRDAESVTVIGEVVRPGAVAFKAGLSAEGYISAAGGRGPKASDIYVIKAGSGQVVPVGQTPILSGDFVFVNRDGGDPTSSDLERLSLQNNDARIRKFQVGLQTVGTVLSVVTTTLLVLNALNN